MRAVVTVAGGLAVLVASFWLTLKIIDSFPSPQQSDLALAMAAKGYTMSDAIVGSVDLIGRDSSGRLQLAGWAFDKETAQPVTVMVLVGPTLQQIAVTNGARPDVTIALKESAERSKNVAFEGTTNGPLDCGPHTVVGVNQVNHLGIVASGLVVPRCTS